MGYGQQLGQAGMSGQGNGVQHLGQDQSGQLSIIGRQLREVKEKLMQIDAIMRRSPAAVHAVGRETVKAWEQYTWLVSNYQRFRVLFGLAPESGLAGHLGQIQFVVGGLTLAALAAGIAALLVTVGVLLQRALDASKTIEALSTAVASDSSGTRFTTVTTPAGQIILVPQAQNVLDWILENPGIAAVIALGGVYVAWNLIATGPRRRR